MRMTAFQPSLDDYGPSLVETTFCVFDLETTGTSGEDTITEIGAIKVRGGAVLAEFNTLVNPDVSIPAYISVLTGITNQMVASSPKLASVLPAFLEFTTGSVLVAHNARFDVGFVKRACEKYGYDWPGNEVIDTLALARNVLLREETPNFKLSTLASLFQTSTTPNHRALDDARATVDVLHGLLERVGSQHVTTLSDLNDFMSAVSPARRAKRTWASALPMEPGVYRFYVERPDSASGAPEKEVLYVGKASNLRRRVATYFTASEKRARMEEMIRIATGVDHEVCATELEASVRELRLIASHDPRYNRRSRRQQKAVWVKVTNEKFPRLSIVNQISDPDCLHWGPFSSKSLAEHACSALYEIFPIRQCTKPLSKSPNGCVLAGLNRCLAPCLGTQSSTPYDEVVRKLCDAMQSNLRPTLLTLGAKVAKLSEQERYEEAAVLVERARILALTTMRTTRISSLAGCAQIVAAAKVDGDWQVHVIRYGRLVGAARCKGRDPRQVADEAASQAESVLTPVRGAPACTFEEADLVASWLESPGVRLLDIDGDWSWPTNAGVQLDHLPAYLFADTPRMIS